ncbi:MAG: serine/threonine-protein phosphatase [Prevotella sp.]|nr:serine/threonine-protein phosphatase [Prevotella sp.]
MTTEADETAEEGYVYAQEALKLRQNAGAVEMSMTRVATTISKLQLSQRFDDAEKWIGRYDSLMKILEVREKDALTLDIYKAFGDIYHMTNALGQKQREKADSVYKEYLKTEYAKTYAGRVSSSDYFFQAERWSECADLLGDYEAYATSNGKDYSLDVLRNLSMKFIANYKAGRRDTALYVANNILEHIDSAIIRERESSATEMATIYETNKKDAEIAQQKIELSQQRLIGLIIAIVLLIIFFVIYTLLRRRSARRMAEIRAKQERIEGELQIARNIQMSMVPSQFPDYEGLDMYASMSPAKEVGGDLYGYVLLGNKLYIAIGDVSGKGVPASLFMAQATRLFRTLAAQQMMPAEICTRMNEALSGDDNESGMFVTFWLGLLDLKTGHLNFCNAGHNPPIVGGGENRGDFLEMIPNAPIGLWPGMEYEGEEIDTINGRPLFVYTDGVNEAENLLQEQFGDDRLLGILRTAHFDSAQQVVEMLKAEVEKHRDGAEPNDDLTMMCIFYETKDVTGGKSFITSCKGRHS